MTPNRLLSASWCCDLPVSSGACVAPRPSKLDYIRSKPNICADTSKAGNYSQIPVVLFTLCCTGRRLAVQLSSSPNAMRLANLPNFSIDRLSRYESSLSSQARQILFALDALDRRKPQERAHRSRCDKDPE